MSRESSPSPINDVDPITHVSARRGMRLLAVKSKVYLHPTSSAADNVVGMVTLMQRDSDQSLYLAWQAESEITGKEIRSIYDSLDMHDADSPPKATSLVPAPPVALRTPIGASSFAVPLNRIYSLLLRPASPGWWHGSIVINLKGGDSMPPLFFHDAESPSTLARRRRQARETDVFGPSGQAFWGGDEVLRWMRRYVTLQRSGAEANAYLVNPTEEDLQAFGRSLHSTPPPDPVLQFIKNTGWNIMERFSKVTTLTRRAVLESPNLPAQVRRLVQNPDVVSIQEEYDSARIYLARWAASIADQSERDKRREREHRWTAQDVHELEHSELGDFELISATSGISLRDKLAPITTEEWKGYFSSEGMITATIDEVKARIFHGGCEDAIRKEVWPYLLGIHEWHSTRQERMGQLASLRDEYYKLKQAWWDRLDGMGGTTEQGEYWREQRNRIEKDVHRTDRHLEMFKYEDIPHPDPDSPFAEQGTNVHIEQIKEMLLTYNEYNKSLGYVQGMSDLLAPIYVVMQDDAIAFWCFQKFMNRMERNFLTDQSGMRNQLQCINELVEFMDPKLYEHLKSADSTNFFFFFRMLLIWFKREFEFNDILRLWEALWTDYLSSSYCLFIAFAILQKHRNVIMTHLKRFDEVLKYINELSGTIDLGEIMGSAEELCLKFRKMVEAVDRKDKGESRIVTPELRRLLTRNVEISYVEKAEK